MRPASRQASKIVGTLGPSFQAGTSRPVSGTQFVTMPWSRGAAPVAKVAWLGYVAEVITERARTAAPPATRASSASTGVWSSPTWRAGSESSTVKTTFTPAALRSRR